MTPRERRAAAVIFALLLPAVAAVGWSLHRHGSVERPGPLRTFAIDGHEHAALFFGGALHLLDASGERRARQPLQELALTEEPNDIDITRGADGAVQAWFFEDTTPRIVRCELAREPLRWAGCRQVLAGDQLKVDAGSRAVHLAADPARGRVFVADARGHRVRALGLDGRHLGDSAAGELFFPNRLRVAGDRLVVADNDHHRIAWLDIGGERPSFLLRAQLPLGSHPDGGGRKAADFVLTGDDGSDSGLWALAVEQGQKRGRLLAFGPGRTPRGTAGLGPYDDPLIVDRFGNGVLAADFDGVAYYRIGADGSYLGAFGRGAFAEELRGPQAGSEQARLAWIAGCALFALALVVGGLLAWKYSERPGQRELEEARAQAAQVEPQVPVQPVELFPARWFQRQLAVMTLVPVLLMAAFVATLFFLLPHELPPALLQRTGGLLALVGVTIAVFALGAMTTWRVGRRSLRIHADRVEVRLGERVLASSGLATLLASPEMLLVGNLAVTYRQPQTISRGRRWIYDEPALTAHLLARLAPGQLRDGPALARQQLRQLPRWTQALLIVIFLGMAGHSLWLALR